MRNARTEASPAGIRRLALTLGVISALGLVVGLAVSRAQRLPEGPEPIAWDREACAACRMHVGDPRFAAQLQTTDGQILNYDDPGCLLSDLAARRPQVHALWLHDSTSDRWLTDAQSAFVAAPATPMNYGLAVVPRATAGAIDWAQATARVLDRSRRP